MKKIIIISSVIFISFFVGSLTLAAKLVPGEVPVVEPLQPPPQNTKPNVSGNIQSTNQIEPSLLNDKQESTEEEALGSEDFPTIVADPFLPENFKGSRPWLLAAAVAAIGGGLLGFWIHERKKK
jgi:hypothetical protein